MIHHYHFFFIIANIVIINFLFGFDNKNDKNINNTINKNICKNINKDFEKNIDESGVIDFCYTFFYLLI